MPDPDPISSQRQDPKIRVSDQDSIRSVDPDPDPIRIPDPDLGGQKCPTKVEKIKKFHVLNCWMFSFESCRLF
jgi:hypothetical protein